MELISLLRMQALKPVNLLRFYVPPCYSYMINALLNMKNNNYQQAVLTT